jgi:hypothetical protein
MAHHVQKPRPVQRVEVECLDGSVVSEQVEKGQ